MSRMRITPEMALAAALAEIDAARPVERYIEASFFWDRADPGRACWAVQFTREAGNARQPQTYERDRESNRIHAITTWRAAFFPDPEPADIRQPEAT